MRKKRGTLLIYILFVVLFVTVFLTAATFTMTNTAFLTKKMESENLAYWAAISGLEYVNYNIKNNLNWPNSTSIKSGTVNFGRYKITETDNGSCFTIKGICGEPDTETYSEFCVAFSKTSSPTLVPKQRPSGTEYYSYNNSSEEQSINNVIVSSTGKSTEHSATIASRGIYVTIDAKARTQRCVIEKLFQVAGNEGFDAAMYAGGDIDVELTGTESRFNVAQKTGERPSICTNGEFNLKRKETYEGEDRGCNLNDGTIYYRTKCNIFGQDIMEEAGLRRKNGILLNQMKDEPNIPRIPWNKIRETVTAPAPYSQDGFFKVVEGDNGIASAVMKAGTYVLIKDAAEPKGYSLFRFNNKGTNQNFIDAQGAWLSDSPLNQMDSAGYGNKFKDLGAEKITFQKLTQTDGYGNSITIDGYVPVIDLENDTSGNPILNLKGTVHLQDTVDATGLTLIALEKDGSKFKPLSSGTPQLNFSPVIHNLGNHEFVRPPQPPLPPYSPQDPTTPMEYRATLSSDGPILVKGRLTGVGRIVVGDDISFETGSGVMNYSNEPDERIAIYSKGSVIMTTLSMPSPSTTVDLVQQAISGLKGSSEGEILHKALDKSITGKESGEQTLRAHLTGLGYTNSEIVGIVSKSIHINAQYNYEIIGYGKHGPQYKLIDIHIKENPYLPIPPPSSFKGVIYAWENFIAKSDTALVGSSFTLNGVLVAFGGDPSNEKISPGANGNGNIIIDNCIDFNILYDPSDLEYITKNIGNLSSVRLYELMFNKII